MQLNPIQKRRVLSWANQVPTGEEVLGQIDACLDGSCHPDSNLQHLRHLLEGYRAFILNLDREEGCPYSPDSARANSWQLGSAWAAADLDAAQIGTNKC